MVRGLTGYVRVGAVPSSLWCTWDSDVGVGYDTAEYWWRGWEGVEEVAEFAGAFCPSAEVGEGCGNTDSGGSGFCEHVFAFDL